MSANFDDDVTGPFDGDGDQWEEPSGGSSLDEAYRPRRGDDQGGDQHDRDRGAASRTIEASGLEVIGGALFLVGCLPAAAVAKAILDGTNLAAPGLGGTAALAAKVAHWLGPWAALITSAAIAVLGALMVLGSLRTEPLRRVAGVLVSGLGLAAIMGALAPQETQGLMGGGGQIGFGTGGALGGSIGAWAGVLLGFAVIAGAAWLGFAQGTPVIDEDDGLGPIIERDELPRASAGSALAKAAGAAASVGAVAAAAAAAGASIFKRDPRPEAEVLKGRSNRQRRVSNKKVRRPSAPVTLGDALARGGTEGVSHDEAAALAPDEKTLAYMEDVWRRAAHSMEQTDPIPASPYPEDVRLKGQIPQGAAPLKPRPGQPEGAPPSEVAAPMTPIPEPSPSPVDLHVAANAGAEPAGIPREDVAPFDFDDELSTPKSLTQVPPPSVPPLPPQPTFALPFSGSREADPFSAGTSQPGLSAEEAASYGAAVLREGASATGPSELPKGVTPFVPKSPEEAPAPASPEVAEVPAPSGMGTTVAGSGSVSFSAPKGIAGDDPMAQQAMQAGAMPASVSPPPRPAWEVGYDDDEDDDDGPVSLSADVLDSIPDVDPKGHWRRRDEGIDAGDQSEGASMEPPSMSVLDELLAQVEASENALIEAEIEVPQPEVEPGEAPDEIESEVDEEDLVEAEEDVYEYVDEDGNTIDPSELGEEYEFVEEDEEEAEYEEVEEDEEEEDEEEDDEEAEYEEDEEYEEAVDVVLEPQAPPVSEPATVVEADPDPPEGLSGDGQRLLDAGRLVITKDRAAVSVIQKGFDVEFAEACSVLEALFVEGLIGPYQEGKKRAILMSLEEWEGHFAHS